MKSRLFSAWIAVAAVAAAGVVVTGCVVMDAVTTSLSEFREAAIVAGDEPVVYAKSRESLEGMGYVYERGSLADHRLEMVTRILPGGPAQNLRQRRAVLEFRAMGSEGTDVRLGIWEATESAESGERTSSMRPVVLLRGGAAYQAFWDRLGQALPDRPIQPKPDEAAASPAK